jgi:predicted regulator of Ras-like GTPase activity (Roadblock/LC7/MglB family)
MIDQTPAEELTEQLRALRERVVGVTECVISTADGLLVAADVSSVHPESMSALAAAALGLGRRTAVEAGLGGLRDVVTRCAAGYIVVLAIGDHALLVVIGDEGLDIPTLHREHPATAERLHKILTQPDRP